MNQREREKRERESQSRNEWLDNQNLRHKNDVMLQIKTSNGKQRKVSLQLV